MEYGSFSSDGREYIINRWDPPRPWINFLTNGRYCALVSHTGGGYSYIFSSGYERILRALPSEAISSDRPGRYVYVRDRRSGEYWSINWQPVRKNLDSWQCRHGLGYTSISSTYNGISGKITFFVPLDDDIEIWDVTLRNVGDEAKDLDVFTYCEWCLGNYAFDLIENAFANLFNIVKYDGGFIFATKNLWNVGHRPAKPHSTWDRFAFAKPTFEVVGYDCVKDEFIGRYRSLSDPIALETGTCSCTDSHGSDSIAVFQSRLRLLPGQEYRFNLLIGTVEEKKSAEQIASRYDAHDKVDRAFDRLNAYWNQYLDVVKVETPDPEFDLSVNVWNKYQAWATSHWARMASYYVGGGSIIGLRDRSQDILGVLPMLGIDAKDKIVELLRHQFSDGSCLHNWDPITDTGPKTGHSDDPLWLVQLISEYVKETGELEFLDEEVDYYDSGSGTVYDHMLKALRYTLSRSSERGLPLIGAGDWNDGLDQVGEEGKGESVMVAQFLCWMLDETEKLAKARGDRDIASWCKERYEDLAGKINDLCWDGEWYVMCTTDSGRVLGSRNEKECKIYLNTQAWAVLSKVAPPERALKCMESVRKHLDTPYGPALFLPAFGDPDSEIGIITMFAPGTKENGTIFNHPVAWTIIAEVMIGRAERAYELFKETSFIERGKNPEIYQAEPYVYAEYVHGPDSPQFGRGEFTWTTGTASWMWRACLDWILGIRPELEGLRIDPCIPSHWREFRVQRRFRGSTFRIYVQNPKGASKGIESIKLDGKELPTPVLPSLHDNGLHEVMVTMG